MTFKTLYDIDITGKTVLLRGDLNVPAQGHHVTDTSRIDRLKPTIAFLHENGAKTLILSHFGRPKGERKQEFSLAFLAPVLEKQWNTPVGFADDCVGDSAQKAASGMKNGDIILLENTRFHAG